MENAKWPKLIVLTLPFQHPTKKEIAWTVKNDTPSGIPKLVVFDRSVTYKPPDVLTEAAILKNSKTPKLKTTKAPPSVKAQ